MCSLCTKHSRTFFSVLGIKLRVLGMLSKYTDLHTQLIKYFWEKNIEKIFVSFEIAKIDKKH
jgi:hypothetical protein